MSKRLIKIRFQNGLALEGFKKEVFDTGGLSLIYEFVQSDEPDFIVFGPYGNDLPPKGNYTRIGYFCENIKPDLSICEWAFGIPREEEIASPKYKRILWHGFNPDLLLKKAGYDYEKLLASKTKFCNFLYSAPVPYREAFFKQLSKYKKIDAPGLSMNNMPGIDTLYQGDKWEVKRQFLSPYKFTIAFENQIFPGYQTEKLYDAMLAETIPIYCGDPFVSDIFNTQSFINTTDYNNPENGLTTFLGKLCQNDFVDIRPQFYHNPWHRIKRKLKATGRKLNLQIRDFNFGPVIERIMELDNDDEKYLEVLRKPWFNNDTLPPNTLLKSRWEQIFSGQSMLKNG